MSGRDRLQPGQKIGTEQVRSVIASATVLYEGWELDNVAWLVEMESGRRAIVMTSHDGFYESTEDEVRKRIEITERSVQELRALVDLQPDRVADSEPITAAEVVREHDWLEKAAGSIKCDKIMAGTVPDPDGSLLRMTNAFIQELQDMKRKG